MLPLLGRMSKLPPTDGVVILLVVLPLLGLYLMPEADLCALFWAGKGYAECCEEGELGEMSPRERLGEDDMVEEIAGDIRFARS